MDLELSKDAINTDNSIETKLNMDLKDLKYDVHEDRKNLNGELSNSKVLDDVIKIIDISDINMLANFGSGVASEISKAADVILKETNIYQVDKTKNLLDSLDKIMKKIDINEINKEPNVFESLFNKVKYRLDKLLSKYNTMGKELDKIYVELKIHENEIIDSNEYLKNMFNSNVKYYHDLIKYILAGDKLCNELQKQIKIKEEEFEKTNNNSIKFEISNLSQGLLVLEQRVNDLKITENVAIQSIPMINTMAYTNVNLIRKINSAFIITLPIFKQALAQAVLLKKQKLQTDMLKKFDEKTNEMLLNNANNNATLSKSSVEMAQGSSIKIETLEATWKIIVDGIEETKKMQQDAYNKCKEDAKRLEIIKKEFEEKFGENKNLQIK